MITHEEIKNIATLCKLHIDDSDLPKLSEDMQKIIDFADTINNAQVENIETDSLYIDEKSLRDDIIKDSYTARDILSNANEGENGFFVLRGRK